MIYKCRQRNTKEDIVTESGKALNFFYGNIFGRCLLKIATKKWVSNLLLLI